MDEEMVRAYQSTQQNDRLKSFHRDIHAGFERQRIELSAAETDKDFKVLEQQLSGGRKFLSGSVFGLADIAWIPNFHRFDLIGWPFDNYPALQRWFSRVSSRASYQTALENWEPRELLDTVAPRLEARRASGYGIENYLVTNVV